MRLARQPLLDPKIWHRCKDLNLNPRFWRPLYYLCTTPIYWLPQSELNQHYAIIDRAFYHWSMWQFWRKWNELNIHTQLNRLAFYHWTTFPHGLNKRIWTFNLLVPSQVLYQIELHSDKFGAYSGNRTHILWLEARCIAFIRYKH